MFDPVYVLLLIRCHHNHYFLYSLLKELRHDILSHFFNGLNYGSSVGKPNNNGLLTTKNTEGSIL